MLSPTQSLRVKAYRFLVALQNQGINSVPEENEGELSQSLGTGAL